MNPRILLFLTLLGSLPLAHAQYEIRGGATNLLDSRRAGASATVAGGAVTAITVRGGGAGYLAAPAVTIGPPASGTTATATAVLTGGVVTAIIVNNGDQMGPEGVSNDWCAIRSGPTIDRHRNHLTGQH
jgi:hypothetical protein